jgi:hypothetical protein
VRASGSFCGSRQPSLGPVIAPSQAQNPGFIAISRPRAKRKSLDWIQHSTNKQSTVQLTHVLMMMMMMMLHTPVHLSGTATTHALKRCILETMRGSSI